MSVTLRHQTHIILSTEPPHPPLSILAAVVITGMIIINVVAVILASVPSINQQFFLVQNNRASFSCLLHG